MTRRIRWPWSRAPQVPPPGDESTESPREAYERERDERLREESADFGPDEP